MTWDDLIMQNKRLLDKGAERFFFVRDPIKIRIENAPEMYLKLRRHPEDLEKGYREFKTGDEFYVCSEDIDDLKEGDLVRLMDGYNFRKKGDGFAFDSIEYD